MSDEQPRETRVPTAGAVAIASFHVGAHPQRPIPQDLTEQELVALDRERSMLHATNRVPMEKAGPTPSEAPTEVNVFSGPSLREERLLAGIAPETLDRIEQEREERAESDSAVAAKEQAAAARNERRSAPQHGPEPDAPHHTEATLAASGEEGEPKPEPAPPPDPGQPQPQNPKPETQNPAPPPPPPPPPPQPQRRPPGTP